MVGKKGSGGGAKPADGATPRRVIARNRRARHDYEILDTWQAGIQLLGSEVKSLREGRASLAEAYARVSGGEVFLHGMHIPPYSFSRDGGHDPLRPRKLLLRRREIEEVSRRVSEAGLTIVPLEVAFVGGLAKVEIGLGRGKKQYDKRQSQSKADAEREMARGVASRRRRHHSA